MWWIIHWVFYNPQFGRWCLGTFSPTGLCNLWQTYAHIILCHMAPSGLRSGQTPFCPDRCTLDFLQRHDRVWGCLSPTCSTANHTHPIRVLPGKHTLSNWLAENQPRQTLIGIEWDCSVRQCSDFANVRAWIWQNCWSEKDFWFPLLFCYRDQVGNR